MVRALAFGAAAFACSTPSAEPGANGVADVELSPPLDLAAERLGAASVLHEPFDYELEAAVGVLGHDQGGGASDHGGREGRPAGVDEAGSGEGRDDVHAWRGNIHGLPAVVGELGQFAGSVERGHRDQVRQIV